ncbi:MCE family protein [Nocardioides halotolerans]|uniref:MCE family protein n=1 Tax=Nocardioides halotolerans TaxID=433660 RepID=UPI00146C8C42|nr:MlaD family protein [Nocardioides halotolerans]
MSVLSERDPFRIGIVALVVGGLVAAGVVLLSTMSFGTTTYTAVLEHTAGLRAGEDVQVHGVPVGEVRSVGLGGADEATYVEVRFTLDSGIRLGRETTAEVKVATLLGTHYLEVDPQGPGSLAGSTIPLERTSVPYNLQDVLEQGTEALDRLDPVLLARALTATSDALGSSSEEVGPALEGIAQLSEVISTRSEQTGRLLRAARGVSDQLDAGSDDLFALMRSANLVIEEVVHRREAIHQLLVETTGLADALDQVVRQTRGDLDPALRDLNSALGSLRRQDRRLQAVLTEMAPAVRYVANATGNGPYLDLFLNSPALPADDASCALGNCR